MTSDGGLTHGGHTPVIYSSGRVTLAGVKGDEEIAWFVRIDSSINMIRRDAVREAAEKTGTVGTAGTTGTTGTTGTGRELEGTGTVPVTDASPIRFLSRRPPRSCPAAVPPSLYRSCDLAPPLS